MLRARHMAGRLHHSLGVPWQLSTAILLGLAVLAPLPTAAADHPSGTAVIIFVDFSGSIRGTERLTYRREIETAVLPSLAPGDRILIASIHDKTFTAFRPLAEATFPAIPEFSGWMTNRMRHARQVKATEEQITQLHEQLKGDVAHMFSRPMSSRYTDIFSSMLMAQKLFSGEARRKVLVLMSDMIEDYPPYKFDARAAWRPGTTEQLLDELQAKRLIADLSGVCVYVSGASAPSPELAQHIARFWDAYFRRAGAQLDASRYAHVLLHWPPATSCGTR